jgi:hypothetical protein
MFLTLLVATFLIASITSAVVAWIFYKPIQKILKRILTEEVSDAWQKYISFAILVVGISGGVRIWSLEKYIQPQATQEPLQLNADRWTLEIYQTLISSMQSITWMLLVFFIFSMLAYVIIRVFEIKKNGK